jgi:pSer/pThr/pTyr-binding forkhead associated (FHA) protein
MSDTQSTSGEPAGLPVQGPHWRPVRVVTPTAEFTPLRLVLQPSGVTLELTHPNMMVGRHTESDIRLPLPDVSRRHCRFLYADGKWSVVDLQSLNGTFVNQEPVEKAELQQNDLVQIGSFTFRIDLCQGQDTATPPEGESLAQRIFKFRPRSELLSEQQRKAS